MWATRWDEYVAPACGIKRTTPDSRLPSAMAPFQFVFGRSPRTTLDMPVLPQMDGAEATGGLANFIENRRHHMREVAEALERIHEDREITRQRRYADIRWPSLCRRVSRRRPLSWARKL